MCRDAAVSTLLTDLASLLLTCADATVGELPSYLKLHVLPHLPVSPGLQVRIAWTQTPLCRWRFIAAGIKAIRLCRERFGFLC